MAIGTGAEIDFFGTQDTVSGTTAAVANNGFSATGDISAWTNDDDARQASITLTGTFAVAPTLGTYVNLYARLMNVDGTSDNPVPSVSFLHTCLGSFPVDDVTSSQVITLDIPLPNAYTSQVYEFYIENKSGQSLNSGWTLKVTPKAAGPHA